MSFSLKAVNWFIKDKSKFYFEVNNRIKLIHIRNYFRTKLKAVAK